MAITPCLWFESAAEEAARFYTSLIPGSEILQVRRQGGNSGPAVTVSFTLDGRDFLGLNGGSAQPVSDAVSFMIPCADQAEVDRYWDALTDGGEPGRCGWLKDRWGMSWQVVPTRLPELLGSPDPEASGRVMARMLTMSKLDIAALEDAASG